MAKRSVRRQLEKEKINSSASSQNLIHSWGNQIMQGGYVLDKVLTEPFVQFYLLQFKIHHQYVFQPKAVAEKKTSQQSVLKSTATCTVGLAIKNMDFISFSLPDTLHPLQFTHYSNDLYTALSQQEDNYV